MTTHARSVRTVSVVGCHAEGEIGDVIVDGMPIPEGASVYERMVAFRERYDDWRRFLILEPRGSVARHVNLLVPPSDPRCAAGAIIMEPTEYVPSSGSNLMCIATVLLETGRVPMVTPVTRFAIEVPGGVVEIEAHCEDGHCRAIEIANVPSFVDRLDAPLEVAGVGTLSVDVAYGGMFYALVDATRLGYTLEPHEARDLAVLGEQVRRAAREQWRVVHPENPGIAGVSIVQLHEPFRGVGAVTRNTCIVAPGRSDRSPTGTGTCARMAVLHARGQLRVGEGLTHASLIGSRFEGRILSETTVAGRPAIRPSIRGRAWITGYHEYVLNPSDPFPAGYLLADTWGVGGDATQDGGRR